MTRRRHHRSGEAKERKLRGRGGKSSASGGASKVSIPNRAFEVIVRGAQIGSSAGAAEIIGSAIQRVARLFRALSGGEPFMESLAFANSVHIKMRPRGDEVERARRRLNEVPKAANGVDAGADPELRRALAEAVTDIQVAAALAADLLDAPAAEAPERVVRFGSEVALAYRSLATAIANNDLTLTIKHPERERPARLGADKAERVTLALRSVTEPRKYRATVVGMLSLADSTSKEFGLRLDPKARKPPVLRGKRLIRGGYAPKVEDLIRDRGLWGKRVRARIEISRDPILSTSTIRPPTYRLLHVEEAGT